MSDIGSTLKYYDVKYMFVESGELSILSKIQEIWGKEEIPEIYKLKTPQYWIELSWSDDQYDMAVNAFGNDFDEAFDGCIDLFKSLVREDDGHNEYAQKAKELGIFDTLMNEI